MNIFLLHDSKESAMSTLLKMEEGLKKYQGGLSRLPHDAYRGHNWVHWSMTIKNRRRDWLDPLMHSRIREALLHALGRHHLICPAYCLMPDHAHFLIGGLHRAPESDQRLAVSLFRREWNRRLKQLPLPCKLQKQPHDHVLRKRESDRRDAFEAVAGYILMNPIKSRLAERLEDWQFLGCLVSGYPELHPIDDDFWERFWKIYYLLLRP